MTVKLSPVFNDDQLINGIPASGALLFTYAAGSSTKQTTYTSATGTVAQSNPIVLNARGEPASPIWLTSGLSYKFVFAPSTDSDPPVAPIRTIDNVTGVNDSSVSISEWIDSGATPTYVTASTFTLAGDQTTEFSVGRRVKCTVTAGTVYGYINTSAYAAVTTVGVVLDSGALDSGLSAVSYGIITPTNTSAPILKDSQFRVSGSADQTKRVALEVDGLTTNTTRTLTVQDASGTVMLSEQLKYLPIRQTVLSGTVDSSGLPSFGGSTGAATVTTSTTLIATAANGWAVTGQVNLIGSITNPSWTGLTTNGTMYLYLDIATDGTCTTGSTTLAPTYQWGGTYSTTNGQFTFNIQEMTGKVGNGTTAAQTYRVFVGEVTVAANVVSAITWYALQGRYDSGLVATLPAASTAVSANHNIGVKLGLNAQVWLECIVGDLGYSIGDRVSNLMGTNGTYGLSLTTNYTGKTVGFGTANGQAINIQNKAAGTNAVPTSGSWKYGFSVTRTW